MLNLCRHELIPTDSFQARHYASSEARFVSPDPSGLAAVEPNNPATWNRYTYANGNPVAFVDPLGLDSELYVYGQTGKTCTLDGIQTDCGNINWEADAACPANFCSGVAGGVAVTFVSFADGNSTYIPTSADFGPLYELNGFVFGTEANYTAYEHVLYAPDVTAAYNLACQHASTPCQPNTKVDASEQGGTVNDTFGHNRVDPASVDGDYTEPGFLARLFHPGEDGSWYTTSGFGVFGFDVGHVVNGAGNSISSHIDQFGPFNPLHAISAAAAKLFGTTWSDTYICSPVGGCH